MSQHFYPNYTGYSDDKEIKIFNKHIKPIVFKEIKKRKLCSLWFIEGTVKSKNIWNMKITGGKYKKNANPLVGGVFECLRDEVNYEFKMKGGKQ